LVILSVDITLRKIEEERRNRYVAGLEGVVDDVSHKMRAPLTLLQSIVENELEFVASHPELASIVGYLKESVLALDAHTRDLTQKIQDLREGVR
jgi:signal transduction histidine kinase